MDRTELVRQLRDLEIQDRDLLVHSSLNSLGYVHGGAMTVVAALREAVGKGNLLFPTHTWDQAMRPGDLRFDVRFSPVQKIGVIPETARRLAGRFRSLHPTHSVCAFGPDAAWYVEGHDRSPSNCGEGSPYWKLADRRGQILLLGVDHNRNTSIHAVEEFSQVPSALEDAPRRAFLVDVNGIAYRRTSVPHSQRPRDFSRVEVEFSRLGIHRIVRLGEAECRLADAARQREYLLKRLAHEPEWLMEGEGR